MSYKYRNIILIILIGLGSTAISGQTFEILKGEKQVTIPFEYRQNFIIIEIELGGTLPLHFIFDTGAEHSLLFKQTYAQILDLEYDGSIRIIGSDLKNNVNAWISRAVDLKVPPLESIKTDLLILDQDYLYLDKLVGQSIDGILGANFFHDHVLRIDYENREITIYQPDAFEEPNRRKFREYQVDIRRKKPYLTFTLNPRGDKSIPAVMLIDSGAGISVLLHSNTHPDLHVPDSTILGQVGAGLGGYLSGYIGKIHSLTLDDQIQFNDMVVSFQDLDSTLVSTKEFLRNGLIGNVILSRFELIIDYPRRRLFLSPERNFNRSFRYDRSGMIIFATGEDFDQYYVKAVIPGSPADRAGIKPGDKLKWFKCFPASWYSLEGILSRLKKKGDKKIRLSLIRDGKKLRKSFYLRDLF